MEAGPAEDTDARAEEAGAAEDAPLADAVEDAARPAVAEEDAVDAVALARAAVNFSA